ncbi:MAG: acetyl-CoA carboxylase carboxyltransferase subunit beta [Bacteroidetes bacterium]|nr:acetyl-CoA carboxylase carboxyltransferase subunit beta [Bacteroidota bacterium]MBV6462477.1 Acetyl-coenzyme A carboxylase carboxyl transferase subunit beta [Flavobacteriales bacterium]WKZ74357.1 MAG: acetyl-CoA carboxylase, carboxyltransferase subunit beta [Vicingaceae bacterium]MCL4817023.1 acetyl-CoA carboxylase, carboxyltransferase subunit beta [Flavobacteriales bacterium]NOG94702.1 acetyl-CoA carboxylase carboxyltransferase subunit beta [Bacteroidota bacterium]
MGWFKRIKEGIVTPTKEKKETPEGLWYKCPKCKQVVTSIDHANNLWVCDACQYHSRIDSEQYFSFLFDDGKYKELNENISSADPLKFTDTKGYKERIAETQKKSGLTDAVRTATGKINKHTVVMACMDFNFIGGSMGSVVGEKIARAIDHSLRYKIPFIMISKSGGARMMEAAFSLMQMAKTSAKLSLLAQAKIPYISILTDPTTGGITASFAMLGDLNIAEPNALIGFAGPRVVKETIKKDLPEGFQTSEFVLEHGFLDLIVNRKDLKTKLSHLLEIFKK